ncbi:MULTISPECIES: carbohydrate ABC transporter permease [unclassified Mesorhizobium]|uniref:carbohydrate ABC transporter permease n=2 Tax=Mesorhizobium TaxID=68287 RepID=UPI000FE78E25|nr:MULTISPECIES: carbohydrate ABC transporter permease [unclassified Mesorhizobium]MDG4891510.1 carbohydrate ABC transporter permease [Mesorhizobium sp. WSM4887]MDG4900890.1 carbohydrate ABC transporter permease [Mesorhizobium sp. WSM4962]MDG4916872.1 carbohydrate ABC transporter permease [Mesorhizobium sp. WSM4989]RWG05790.1 MAG: carbohydrate ABC transporter permease [Mesorhizobium sp.]RWH02531.1 MAG: carbohydrate ABC transporter permease [Mesorhizobium sp.]
MRTEARSARRSHQIGRLFIYGSLIALAAFYLMPLWVMIVTSLKSLDEIYGGSFIGVPQAITFEAWNKAWQEACIGTACTGLRPYFINSILMVVPAVILSTGIGAINGYILTKWRFAGANATFGLLLFGCFLPFQAVILPMAQLLGRLHLSGTIPGLVLVHTVYGISFTTLFFRNYFITIPDELTRAAQIDGAGFFRIFFSVMLPTALPIIVVSCIWQFTQIWNDFLFGVSFTAGQSSPITVALNNIVNVTMGRKQYNVDMAAAMIAAIPTLLVYVVAGRYFVRGLTAGAVKG